VIEQMSRMYRFYIWNKVDEKSSAIRLVTSWATGEEPVDAFLADLAVVTEK
jgi:threonine aldolase